MKKNMGKTDTRMRIVAAIAILLLYLAGIINGLPALVLLVIAVALAFTSALGICPLYSILGVSTCKQPK